jgi:hypothetical protein
VALQALVVALELLAHLAVLVLVGLLVLAVLMELQEVLVQVVLQVVLVQVVLQEVLAQVVLVVLLVQMETLAEHLFNMNLKTQLPQKTQRMVELDLTTALTLALLKYILMIMII